MLIMVVQVITVTPAHVTASRIGSLASAAPSSCGGSGAGSPITSTPCVVLDAIQAHAASLVDVTRDGVGGYDKGLTLAAPEILREDFARDVGHAQTVSDRCGVSLPGVAIPAGGDQTPEANHAGDAMGHLPTLSIGLVALLVGSLYSAVTLYDSATCRRRL